MISAINLKAESMDCADDRLVAEISREPAAAVLSLGTRRDSLAEATALRGESAVVAGARSSR